MFVLLHVTDIVRFGEDFAGRQGAAAGIDDDVADAVEDLFEIFEGDVEEVTDAGREAFEEPDVGDGSGEVDVAEAFAADFGLDDFDAAFFADDAAVFHALVFTADALVIFDRSEDAGAEEAVFFGFKGAVVDGFGFFDFAVAPLADLFGGGEADADGGEIQGVFGFLEEAKDIFHRR